MNSAEHRTTGDEGEFYFDPMAPNDRFSGRSESSAKESPIPEEREEEPAEATPEFDAVPVEEPANEESAAPGLENNFAETEDEYVPPPPRDRGGRGSRDRERGRTRPRRDRPLRRRGIRPRPRRRHAAAAHRNDLQARPGGHRSGDQGGHGHQGSHASTHISIAGRYLVLAPWLNRVAVSRKITDEPTRQRLKEIMAELNAPKGVGFIIRTAAVDRNVQELQSDLAYLVRLWEVFCNRVVKRPGPIEVYRESDMVTRTIRDMFASDIDTIWVDEPEAFSQAQEFMKIVMPRYAERLKLHGDAEPIFQRFKLEDEVHKLQDKKVPLPGGGSLVIEQTEALVAIDVNSGTFRVGDDAEETAYQTNLQAAKEIARQLRCATWAASSSTISST